MRKLPIFLAVGILSSVAVPCMADVCSSVSGNIVVNCGFENGVYTSTSGSNSNTLTPNSWTANAGWIDFNGTNQVQSSEFNSGSEAVKIGNDDTDAEPTLSQTLTDISGATYSGTVYVAYGGANEGDGNAFFDLAIGGTNKVTLTDSAVGTFTAYTFSFVGTGSDALTFGGNTNFGDWFVDDISVVEMSGPPPTGAAPEPGSMFLLLTAGGPLYLVKRRLARG